MGMAKRRGRANAQHPLRFDAAMNQRCFSFINFGQNALSAFEKMLSFFRRGQTASATGDQAHFGPTLERR